MPSNARCVGLRFCKEIPNRLSALEVLPRNLKRVFLGQRVGTVEVTTHPVPKMARFTVTGVFETGMYEYNITLVYISIEMAQFLLNIRGVAGIQIKTTDLFKADKIAESVRSFLGGYPYNAIDWQMQNRSLFQWMKLERMIIFLVISLIMVVAAFNIIGTLIMFVNEKNRDIAILKSIGASRKEIMRIFIITGSFIGAAGTILGLAGGYLLCYLLKEKIRIPLNAEVYQIDHLPVAIDPAVIAGVAVTAFVISLVATFYPSFKAASTNPVEGLRYE